MISKHYFKANLSKIKLRWNFPNFWPKSWFNPLKKIQYGDHVKSIFYSLEGLVFLTGWSIYLVTCWLHDILTYLLNYCSTGISSYWLNNWAIYWLWLDLLTEWMTCRDCIALGGLHDCARVLLCLFTVNFIMNPQICLVLRKLQGEWVLAFDAINYGIVWVTVNKFWSWKGG